MFNTTFAVASAHTSLKEINFLMCNSPTTKSNTFADQQIGTIEITNGTLRTLTSDALFTGSLTEMLNKKLPNFQLKQSKRLEIRISKECHKAAAEYRKLNGGHKKTKFNQKIRQISIPKGELEEVKSLSTHTPLLSNNGLRLDNVSNSHKKNVRQKLENNVVKALEFVETFGVLPKKKLVCESFGGGRYVIDMDGNDVNVPYENMSPREKVRVRQILNICDNAMVSDEAYHELAQHVPEMPRKYNLVACRNELDSNIEMNRTPGLLLGSFLSLES